MSQTKKRLVYLAKLGVGGAIVTYYAHRGALTFDWQEPRMIQGFLLLLAIQVGICLLTSYRWYLVTQSLGMDMRYGDCLRLSWVGQFFSAFLAGALSADAAKVYYLRRRGVSLAPVLRSVVLDRATSLAALLVTSGAAVVVLIAGLGWASLLSLIGLGTVAYVLLQPRVPLPRRWFDGARMPPLGAFVIGLLCFPWKAASLWLVVYFSGQAATWGVFLVSLTGMLGEMLPLAPANVGLGHLLFDHLYGLVHGPDGAQVYHVYFTAKVGFKLTGAIGWLMMMRGAAGPSGPRTDAHGT